jgi:hypothetical protein
MSHIMSEEPQYTEMISFRVTKEQAERLEKIVEELKTRQPRLKRAHAYRELFSVEDTGLVNQIDRDILAGKVERNVKKVVQYPQKGKVPKAANGRK